MGKFIGKYKFLLIFVALALSFFAWHGRVRAADPPIPQNTLPSAGDFGQGSSVALITAIYGNGYVLRSPDATVRLYSPNQNNNELTIINGGNCPGQGGDVGPNNSQATTTYRIYAMKPVNGNPFYYNTPFFDYSPALPVYGGHDYLTNNDIGCNSTFRVRFNNPYGSVDSGPASGRWAFEIRATMSGPPGWNQFKYQVTAGGGRLSYYAGSGNHFAVKAATGANPTAGDYKLGFAPGCRLKIGDAPINAELDWFDEDAGESNQGPGDVETIIKEYDENGKLVVGDPVQIVNMAGARNGGYDGNKSKIIYITSGNDVPGHVTIEVKPHHKYEWVHYGINVNNGIQFQLPFDSYNTLINWDTDCPPTNLPPVDNTSCGPITAIPANPRYGQAVSLTVKMSNTGTTNWSTSYALHQNSPPRTDPNRFITNARAPVKPGSPAVSFGYTLSGRNNSTPVTFTYQMRDANGNPFGPICPKTIIWLANPPPSSPLTGNITPNCDQTVISGVSANDNWHPPAGASPTIPPRQLGATPVSKVPAQIIVTDAASGASFTYTVPGGVPNDPSQSVSINTFAMGDPSGNTMWAHKTYNFELVLQGASSFQDSLYYNDDGSWTNAATGGTYYPVTGNIDTGTVGDCLHLSCGSSSTPDVEPGQTTGFSSGMSYTNDTNKSYSTNPAGGYYFHVNTDGGFVGAPGDVGGGNIDPGSGTDNVSFNARLDYTGGYSIDFMFQGSPLDLGQGNPCPEQSVTPATRPYLQVWGGDINTGGGFESVNPATGALSCPTTYPDYVSPATTGDSNSAGIKTFAAADGTYGSLSDFGALSLGVIANNSSAHINFGAQPSFANTAVPEGQLNSTPPAYCVMDFFDKTQKNPAPAVIGPPSSVSALAGSPTDQYMVNQNVDNLGGAVIPNGRKITLYVNGDVTITGNITYSAWDVNNPDSAPAFALIVRGNINIDPGVTRIDGLYVAQPTSSGNDGQFNTCANNGGNQFCVQQFVANGAVIARQIMPLRSVGTLSPDANPGFAPPPGHVPAEIFNYIPSMVISGPNFAPVYNSLQGLFNLPPVF